MTTARQIPPVQDVEAASSVIPSRRRFSTAEYVNMAELGILRPDERVELVKGEILVMPPMGRDHGVGVVVQNEALMPHAPGRFHLWIQTTIHLGEGFSPEPDLVLLRFRQDRYVSQDPTADDVLLVIEIAHSSLAYDRDVKSRLYALAGIPETWVVDLDGRAIERFIEPGPDGYRAHTTFRSGDRLSPTLLPDLDLAVGDLLPPAVAEEEEK